MTCKIFSLFAPTGVEAINVTATEVDNLAPQLVSVAVRVRQTPTDVGCTEHLSQLRREWTARLQVLTSLVDDITDFNDFVVMTGNRIFAVLFIFLYENAPDHHYRNRTGLDFSLSPCYSSKK